jgi:hypothetical protein
MRTLAPVLLAILALASPAAAQLNAYYEGVQRVDGKAIPLTTRYSLEKGRVAALMSGARSVKMLYVQKDNTLRVIDEQTKSYFDLDRKELEQITGGAMAQMQEQMAKMPPEQRAMAEQMMKGAMANMGGAPEKPVTYAWSKETMTVKGYPCTRVDIMRGDEKHAEYWGTTSPDFKITDDERATAKAMHDCLSGLAIIAKRGVGGGETSQFQWDTSTDGYPLICRCFSGADTTLDVHLTRFDRKPLEDDLFKVPDGYKKQEIGGMGPGKGHKREN